MRARRSETGAGLPHRAARCVRISHIAPPSGGEAVLLCDATTVRAHNRAVTLAMASWPLRRFRETITRQRRRLGRGGMRRRGIAAIFLVSGLTLSSWISRIPSISDKHDLSTGQVGTALMALAAGGDRRLPDDRAGSSTPSAAPAR